MHMDEHITLNLEHLIPNSSQNVKVMVLLCGSNLKLPILYCSNHKCCAYTHTKKTFNSKFRNNIRRCTQDKTITPMPGSHHKIVTQWVLIIPYQLIQVMVQSTPACNTNCTQNECVCKLNLKHIHTLIAVANTILQVM